MPYENPVEIIPDYKDTASLTYVDCFSQRISPNCKGINHFYLSISPEVATVECLRIKIIIGDRWYLKEDLRTLGDFYLELPRKDMGVYKQPMRNTLVKVQIRTTDATKTVAINYACGWIEVFD